MKQLQVLTVAIALITFLATLLINPAFAGSDNSQSDDVPVQASDERRP